MSDRETADRYLAMDSGVDAKRLQHQKVQDDDWPMLLRAASDAAEVPLHLLDDGQTSLSSLRAHAHQLRVRYGDLSLIVVDYLQLMNVEDPSGNRTTDVGVLSRGLKILAREFDVPVIAVSQLNRAVEMLTNSAPSSPTCARPARSRPTQTRYSCSTATTTTTAPSPRSPGCSRSPSREP